MNNILYGHVIAMTQLVRKYKSLVLLVIIIASISSIRMLNSTLIVPDYIDVYETNIIPMDSHHEITSEHALTRKFFLNISQNLSLGYRGSYISLALDSNNHPHMSFVDRDEYILKYGYWNGTAWQIETVDYEYKAGLQSSIAIDSKNHPHISYINSGSGIKYARFNGMTWQIEIVDSIGGMDTSLALDSFDRPHICYSAAFPNSTIDNRSTLKYAWYNGSAWNMKTFYNDMKRCVECTIRLDSKNVPHILVFTSGPEWDLIYFKFNGLSWDTEIIQSGDTGDGPSMILDSNDLPHICSSRGYHELLYIHYDGDSWHTEILSLDERKYSKKSIAIDTLFRPHIIYADYDNLELRYKYRINGSWYMDTIIDDEEVHEIAFALDSENRAHICYNHWREWDLKYILIECNEETNNNSTEDNEVKILWIVISSVLIVIIFSILVFYYQKRNKKDTGKRI